MRIVLEIPEDANAAARARLCYAFRLFCAVYGHQPIIGHAEVVNPDVTLRYGTPSACHYSTRGARAVWMTRGYRARDPHQPAPPPIRYVSHEIRTLLHYAPEGQSTPDWIGEIFEWVSCADEYSVTERDLIGRPLFAATYAGRHHLDTRVPYAAIAMQCLQRAICDVVPSADQEPKRPCNDAHLIVPTHDVDYFPAGRWHAANRLVRNAVISLAMNGLPVLGMRQAGMAVSVAVGRTPDPLDQIARVVREERRRGIRATYNFLTCHGHRLDAHYSLDHSGVVKTMRWLESQDMEIGIHGSYRCLDQLEGLARELSQCYVRGFFPRGGRQHWLRYTLDRLIPAVERAGLAYDASLGWSARIGFRAGACFPFPPYNFAEERAATFLEIPMVMMDQAFQTQHDNPEAWFSEAADVLANSRRAGWGGISLLWHPTAFGEGWLPSKVGDIYWWLADHRAECGDEWMSAEDLVETVRPRFIETGLLQEAERVGTDETVIEEGFGIGVEVKFGGLRKSGLKPPDGLLGT